MVDNVTESTHKIDLLIQFFRVDRPVGTAINYDMTARGKRSMVVDLKKKQSEAVITKMVKNVDVLIEPFRTGTGSVKNHLLYKQNW